jgi:hypothetical protein
MDRAMETSPRPIPVYPMVRMRGGRVSIPPAEKYYDMRQVPSMLLKSFYPCPARKELMDIDRPSSF